MSENFKLRLSRWDYATYLGYAGYASGSVIIPMVLVAMSGELGMDYAAGGALHLIRSAVMVVSMLLSGWVAGMAGKPRTLGSAMLLIAAGLLVCSFVSGYLPLAGAIVLIGLGNGLFESLATGFAQDLHVVFLKVWLPDLLKIFMSGTTPGVISILPTAFGRWVFCLR